MKFSNIKNKTFLYIVLVSAIILLILIIAFTTNTSKNANKNNGTVSNITPTVSFQSDVNTTVSKYNFNLSQKTIDSKVSKYSVSLLNFTDIATIAQVLGMTQDTSASTITYHDTKNNSLSYNETSGYLSITNSSNPNLVGFTKDNFFDKLTQSIKLDFSRYYVLSSSNTSSNQINIFGGIKIGNYPVIREYNSNIFCNATIDTSGNILNLTMVYLKFDISGTQNLKTIDDIKSNINSTTVGIYPNYKYSSGDEAQIEKTDFSGTIDLNDVNINYLWTLNTKDILFPVYNFVSNFNFSDGTKLDGSVIVSAISS